MLRANVLLEVARTPSVWLTALRQMRRLTPAGWWRRRPFLPLPSGDYLHFRLVTQYGDATHAAEGIDVVNYLRWCRTWEQAG